MIWAKREFAYAEYAPYMDRLEKLLMANPRQYREFMMVSTQTSKVGVDIFYIGVPNKAFAAVFDGFEIISESELPKEIDTLHVADVNAFQERFRFREPRH
jgi:hypothetical protein